MNDIIGPLIALALGGIAGIVFHLFCRRFWVASALATLTATIIWVGGCYILLALTAPNELGWPLPGPILLTIVTVFAGALVAGGVIRAVRSPKHANRTNLPSPDPLK